MTSARRWAGNLGAGIVGAVVGALLVLAVDGATRAPSPGPARLREAPAAEIQRLPRGSLDTARVLLAWTPGGLGVGTEATVEERRDVRSATLVRAGLDWLERSELPDGTNLDSTLAGYAIPLEVALVKPREYARFVTPSERDLILSLRPGEVLLARTAAQIRGAEEGLVMRLRDRSLTLTGIVSDAATSGYEAIVTGSVPRSWARVDEFLLAEVRSGADRDAIETTIEERLDPGQVLRVRERGETPFLRYGDAVMPQMIIKEAFGEFAARPLSTGYIEIDPRWRRDNIVERNVPILGRITCHRALFPQLRLALEEVRTTGLAYAIDPGDFGGCYSARFIDRDPGGRLSHHSWGIAVDFNVAENRQGTRPNQDPRLVRLMEGWGFSWGGRWLIPDGMHFEWTRFP